MNSGQNGKGDRPRNNWGLNWYSGYDAINWPRQRQRQESPNRRETGRATGQGSSSERANIEKTTSAMEW
jgi:hypothetical protein